MPLSRLALAVALSTRALIAFAEENKDAQPVKLDDVIVTATKEGYVSLQKVPLAISAFTGEDLEASGIKNLEDLQYQTPPEPDPQRSGDSPLFARYWHQPRFYWVRP